MLCEVCQDIFRGSYPAGYSEHHGSIQSLQRSALENCEICRVLWKTLASDLSQLPGSEHVHISTEAKMRSLTHKGTARLYFQATPQKSRRYWEFHCAPAGGYAPFFINDGYLLTFETEEFRDPNADKLYDYSDWTASMACARTWLAECGRNHTNCQVSRSKPLGYCPTRLIEIEQPEADRIRLRLSSELGGTSLQYATLSHCWGTSKTLRLTSDSFRRLRDGVAVSELAKTFQDAVFTAKSLGIKLLWIDSFCILQDSKEDWEQESTLMSQVYRHSFLNIAASIAVDSDAGCFRKRASTVRPYPVQTLWTNHPNSTYYLYRVHYWDDHFAFMPLNRRAWVLQELALAPRVLHLCGSQMFWECHGLHACETWPKGLPPNMSVYSGKSAWATYAAVEIFGFKRADGIGTQRISSDESIELNTTSFMHLWSRIVTDYSGCDLTFPSDKSVALSGIAKHMEQLLDLEYCAGLWRHDLIQGLAWFSHTQSVPQSETDPIPYRAPSWSWACMDTRITFEFHERMQPLADIICCNIRTATADRTGAVVGAALQISGWLATIEVRSRHELFWDVFFDGRWHSITDFAFRLDRSLPLSQLHCLPLFNNHQFLVVLLLTHSSQMRSVSESRNFLLIPSDIRAGGMESALTLQERVMARVRISKRQR